MPSFDDFKKISIRVGTVIRIENFPEARKPAYKMWIDFGPYGVKTSSAQITDHYKKEEIIGKQLIAVTNLPPKQVGSFQSEVLTLGAILPDDTVILLFPAARVPDGSPVE